MKLTYTICILLAFTNAIKLKGDDVKAAVDVDAKAADDKNVDAKAAD